MNRKANFGEREMLSDYDMQCSRYKQKYEQTAFGMLHLGQRPDFVCKCGVDMSRNILAKRLEASFEPFLTIDSSQCGRVVEMTARGSRKNGAVTMVRSTCLNWKATPAST